MLEVGEEQVGVDVRLRFVLFGLECVLGVSFDGGECERIFRDTKQDQVSSKEYLLYRSSRLSVTGRVAEYEPDEILLRVEGKRGMTKVVKSVAEGAKYHALRMRNATSFLERSEPGGEPVSENG